MDGATENGCITEDKCKEDGAVLVADGVICQEEPDDDAVENCKALGKALA